MPPAKLACQGCRLSKVKCDLEHRETGVCSRCSRLGLKCLPTGPSKRGRPHTARDISRLGPKVRQLLVKSGELPAEYEFELHQDDDGEAYVGPMDMSTSVTPHRRLKTVHGQLELCQMNHKLRYQAEDILKRSLTTESAKKAWTRHVMYITQRARSIESMAHVMMLSKEMGFTMDDVEQTMSVIDPCVVPASEPLPEFLAEWYVGSQISLTRVQNQGCMEWLPSPGFERAFGVKGKLDAGMLTLLDTNEDREEVCRLTGRLWAQVQDEVAPGIAQHIQSEMDSDIAITMKGVTYGPFRMRGRLVVKDRSTRTWTCINLAPARNPGLLAAPPAAAQPAGAPMVLDLPGVPASFSNPFDAIPSSSAPSSAGEAMPESPTLQQPGGGLVQAADARADDQVLLDFLDGVSPGRVLDQMVQDNELPLEQLLELVAEQ